MLLPVSASAKHPASSEKSAVQERAAGVKLQEVEDRFPLIKSVCVVENHFLDHKTNH